MTAAQTFADSKRLRVSSYEISSGAIGVTIVAAAVAAAGMAGGANPTMNGAGTGLDLQKSIILNLLNKQNVQSSWDGFES